jgi:phosphatidylinositol glycan class N
VFIGRNIGGMFIGMSGLVALWCIPRLGLESLPTGGVDKKSTGSIRLVTVQVIVVFMSVYLVNDTTGYLNLKMGLPLVNQIAAWTIFGTIYLTNHAVFCLAMPVIDHSYTNQHFLRRLVVIYLAFSPIFILLSVSYETLFFFCFAMMMVSWLFLEKELYEELGGGGVRRSERVRVKEGREVFRLLGAADLRVATFFLLFINISFFGLGFLSNEIGTGNIASIASFSAASVYRFTTLFNPFLMGGLLVVKIMIPFFILSAVLRVVSKSVALPPFSLFLLVLV